MFLGALNDSGSRQTESKAKARRGLEQRSQRPRLAHRPKWGDRDEGEGSLAELDVEERRARRPGRAVKTEPEPCNQAEGEEHWWSSGVDTAASAAPRQKRKEIV